MAQESDLPEGDSGLPAEQDSLGADEAARRRVMEFDGSLVGCEHQDSAREDAAIAESANIVDGWEKADPLTREHMLDRVGREMMAVHESPPPELQTVTMEPNERGRYIDEDFRIEVNEKFVENPDPTDGLTTYLHEFRHAEQAYEVQKSHGPMAGDVNPQRAAELEANQGDGYIDPNDDYDAYRGQISEVDARKSGDTTAGEILEQRDVLRATRMPETPDLMTSDETAAWRLSAEDQPEK